LRLVSSRTAVDEVPAGCAARSLSIRICSRAACSVWASDEASSSCTSIIRLSNDGSIDRRAVRYGSRKSSCRVAK
jgi:hypothetical protein